MGGAGRAPTEAGSDTTSATPASGREDPTVFRNGATSRGRERRVATWMMVGSGILLGAMFLAPATLDAGTVPELSARANSLDYATLDGTGSWGNHDHGEDEELGHNQSAHGHFAWTDLPFLHAVVYGFGDINCHQKHERSWRINDNQMPVCTRDLGIFAGALVGSVVFRRRGHNRWTIRDTFLSVLPDGWLEGTYRADRRLLVALGFAGLLTVPIAMDGGIQAITDYESTHVRRLATGLVFGSLLTLYLGAAMSARPALFEGGAAQVRLPAGARLVAEAPAVAAAETTVGERTGGAREREPVGAASDATQDAAQDAVLDVGVDGDR